MCLYAKYDSACSSGYSKLAVQHGPPIRPSRELTSPTLSLNAWKLIKDLRQALSLIVSLIVVIVKRSYR